MSIESTAVTVAATATLLATGGASAATRSAPGSVVTLKPAVAGTGDGVFVGSNTVTTATGLPLGGGMSFDLGDEEALYGIVASGTVEVRVLEHGI
jgi:hypothetical protein